MKNMQGPRTIEQYALSVIGHLENRIFSYIYDKKEFDTNLNRVLRQISLEANLTNETPIISNMEA